MRTAKRSKGTPQSLEIPGQAHAFLVILALLSSAVALSAGGLFVTNKLPTHIMPMLVLVIGTSALMALKCVQQMGKTRIVFGPSALEVSGPEINGKYPWSKIDAVHVVGATGSLGDDPMVPMEKRIGLALFLKDGKESRTEAGQADAILAAGSQLNGELFVSAAQTVSKAIRSRQRQSGKAAPPRLGRTPRIGMKPAAAA